MIIDIFSSFDPGTYSVFNLYSILIWLISIIFLTLNHSTFWINPTRLFWLNHSFHSIINEQASRTLGGSIKGFSSIISALFFLLIISNLLGLTPYTFRITSHLIFSLSFGLPLWLSLIISRVQFSPSSFIAHLLPAGAPDWLNPFLVLVETVRTIVRPLTLSIRLIANIRAGHVVLTLLGIYTAASLFAPSYSLVLLLLIQRFYVLFEVAICFIQAYIFCLLLTLYSDDHPSL